MTSINTDINNSKTEPLNLKINIPKPKTFDVMTALKVMREVRKSLFEDGYHKYASELFTPKSENSDKSCKSSKSCKSCKPDISPISKPKPLKKNLSWKDSMSLSLCEFKNISPINIFDFNSPKEISEEPSSSVVNIFNEYSNCVSPKEIISSSVVNIFNEYSNCVSPKEIIEI